MTAREHADRAHELLARVQRAYEAQSSCPLFRRDRERQVDALRMEAFAHSVSALIKRDEEAS